MNTLLQRTQEMQEPDKIQFLSQIYVPLMEKTINGEKTGKRELARKVLSWIAHAKTQLTAVELQHALATRPGKAEPNDEDLRVINNMVSACAGLVTINKESNIIQPAHYTI
ncbi:hypothetical protein F5Y14DRAFT_141753 [Nemania sp. NC0429]|nr:hypothetical protein F5Y14DRAFT_141753 [Nemania sp. NC0429]